MLKKIENAELKLIGVMVLKIIIFLISTSIFTFIIQFPIFLSVFGAVIISHFHNLYYYIKSYESIQKIKTLNLNDEIIYKYGEDVCMTDKGILSLQLKCCFYIEFINIVKCYDSFSIFPEGKGGAIKTIKFETNDKKKYTIFFNKPLFKSTKNVKKDIINIIANHNPEASIFCKY